MLVTYVLSNNEQLRVVQNYCYRIILNATAQYTKTLYFYKYIFHFINTIWNIYSLLTRFEIFILFLLLLIIDVNIIIN